MIWRYFVILTKSIPLLGLCLMLNLLSCVHSLRMYFLETEETFEKVRKLSQGFSPPINKEFCPFCSFQILGADALHYWRGSSI